MAKMKVSDEQAQVIKALTAQVFELERKYAQSQAGWRHDLEVLVSLAEKHDETEIAEAGKVCLKNLSG